MKLLALICPHCTEPLKPENEDITTVCPRCQHIFHLDTQGLQSIDVSFMSTGQTTAKEWLPYWVFQGKINITRRDTQGGGSRGAKESEQLWGASRLLYVPAWELPMNRVQEIGGQIIQQQPTLKKVETPDLFRLRPAVITADDARKMLEFIILAIEARREDYLKNLSFQMQLNTPQLWALPG